MKKVDRWEPARRGEIYCAPACGAGCTFADYRLAARRAADAVKILGPKWKPRVWENTGWHSSVACAGGLFTVFIDPKGIGRRGVVYWAMVSLDHPGAGTAGMYADTHSSDPRVVVAATVRKMKSVQARISRITTTLINEAAP